MELKILRASLAQNLLDIDARRALFSHLDAFTIRSRPATIFFGSHSACWPSLGNFSARGAPKFREFCNYFARVLREGLRDSARHLGAFAYQRTFNSLKRCNDVLRFAQPTLAECTQILCAQCAEIPGILQIFARFRCKISTPDARLFE